MNKPIQQTIFKPRRVAVKIHYSAVNQFSYLWSIYDMPCDYTVKRSNISPEYLGICFNIENDKTADLLRALPEKIRGVKIIDL